MDVRIALYALVGLNLGLGLIVSLIAEGPSKLLASIPPLWLGVLGLAALLISADVRSWRRLRRLARAHRDEPWIWDRSWRRELLAENLRQVLKRLAPALLMLAILSGVLARGAQMLYLPGMPWVSLGMVGLILAGNGLVLWSEREKLRPLLSWIHFGRPRLRVPQVPLKLGTRCQLRLVVPPSARPNFARVAEAKAELRRVRQWSKSSGHGDERRSHTIRRTEYTHEQPLDVSALGVGKELVIELKLPEAGAANTSVLHGKVQCFWELHLTGDAPGRKLELCYLLPAYHFAGENPSAWKDAA